MGLLIKIPETPIVQNEKVDLGQSLEVTDEASIRPSDGKFLCDPTDAMVECGVSLPAGLVGKGAGEPTLAYPRRPGDDDVPAGFDPAAGKELLHHFSVEASRRAVVDVFGTGRLS